MGAGGAAIAGSIGQALANLMNLRQQQAQLALQQQRLGQGGSDSGATMIPGEAIAEALRLIPGVSLPEGAQIPDLPASALATYLGLFRPTRPEESERMISGSDIANALRMAGVEPPAGVLFPQMSESLFRSIYPSIVQTLSRAGEERSQPSTVTGGQLSLAINALMNLAQGKPVDLSQLGAVPPSFASEILQRATSAEERPPTTVTPPAGAERLGLVGPIPLSEYETVRRALQPPEPTLQPTPEMRAAGVTGPVRLEHFETLQRLFPQPSVEEQTMITVTDDTERYGEIADYFPEYRGKIISLQQANALQQFIERQVRIHGQEVDAKRRAWELQRDINEYNARRLTKDEAVRFYQNILGTDAEPNIMLDPDGKIPLDRLIALNGDLAEAVRNVQEVAQGQLAMEDKRLDIILKRMELPYRTTILRSQARSLAAQADIDEARADQIVDELRLDRERTQAEIDEIKQRLSQGEKLFDVEYAQAKKRLEILEQEGKLNDIELKYAEDLAKYRAALAQYQALRAQREMDQLSLHTIWVQMGLPGAPPEGVTFYRYQIDEMLRFMESMRGRVVKAGDLFRAAGIDTADMPKDVLNAYVEIDSAGSLLNAIRQAAGAEQEQIANSVDLIAKIINIVSPPLLTNLSAQLIAATNPQLAATMLRPQIEVLKTISPGLYEWAVGEITRVSQQLSILTGGAPVPPEVQQAAQAAIQRAGSAAKAYSIAIDPKNRDAALKDPKSPFYNNPTLYDMYVAYLAQQAGGE